MKRSKLLSAIFFLAFANLVPAQTFHEIFGVHGSAQTDKATCARQTSDGGFIVVATETNGSSGIGNILLVKTDGVGDTTWTHVYGGSNDETGDYVQQTGDGGYILVGSTQSFGQGQYDVYLIKTDANGDTVWTRTYGGTGVDYGYYVQVTNDGGYMIFGKSDVNGGNAGWDGYLVKTDNSGILQWTKTYGTIGGDYAYTALQTSDNGYIMQMRVFDFVIGSWDILLVRADVNGDTLWTKQYEAPLSEVPGGIVQTSDGGFLFAASTTSYGAGGPDILLVKTNSLGDTLFTKTIGGISDDIPYSLQHTNDGGFILCGETWSYSTYSSVYLVKLDANANVQWANAMSGVAYRNGNFASQNSDGSYIIGGSTSDWGTATGDYDAYLIRTAADGFGYCADNQVAPTIGFGTVVATHIPVTVGSGGVQMSTLAPCYRNCVFEVHCASPLTVNENLTNEFTLSPNPSNGSVKVSSDHLIPECTISLYNILGEKLSEEIIKNFTSNDFNFSENATGIYFVRLDDGVNVTSIKMVIQ